MYLFNLLKEVEKLGYIILTYEEAREELDIIPEKVDETFITYQFCFKRYFIINIKNSEKKLIERINLFLKKYKIKNNIFKFKKRKAL